MATTIVSRTLFKHLDTKKCRQDRPAYRLEFVRSCDGLLKALFYAINKKVSLRPPGALEDEHLQCCFIEQFIRIDPWPVPEYMELLADATTEEDAQVLCEEAGISPVPATLEGMLAALKQQHQEQAFCDLVETFKKDYKHDRLEGAEPQDYSEVRDSWNRIS